jgi:hypothetical protein
MFIVVMDRCRRPAVINVDKIISIEIHENSADKHVVFYLDNNNQLHCHVAEDINKIMVLLEKETMLLKTEGVNAS